MSALGVSNKYIEDVLTLYCPNFIGVYSSDNLPTELANKEKFSLVCNLSPSKEPGSHFITIFSDRKHVFYMDSLGLNCFHKSISTFLNLTKKKIIINTTQIQDFSSIYCGFFSILLCMFFENPNAINVSFSKDHLRRNDVLCLYYISHAVKTLT